MNVEGLQNVKVLQCESCGCGKFFPVKKSIHTGLYCCRCLKWRKWATKKEIEKYSRSDYNE